MQDLVKENEAIIELEEGLCSSAGLKMGFLAQETFPFVLNLQP